MVSGVIARRLYDWLDNELPECFNGFRRKRGTVDSLWIEHMIARLRRSHGVHTYAALIDFITAFDKVSRRALFHILKRFGFPTHFINMVRRFHTRTRLKVKVGSETFYVETNSGVRTGALEGPPLFLVCMLAIYLSITWELYHPPVFVTSKYLTNYDTTTFTVPMSAFADDCKLYSMQRLGPHQVTERFAIVT